MFLDKAIIVMVGLSYIENDIIAHKLSHYLNWIGNDTKLFNFHLSSKDFINTLTSETCAKTSIKKFSTSLLNTEDDTKETINNIHEWLNSRKSGVTIYNAPNLLPKIRKMIGDSAHKMNCSLLFVEIQHDESYQKNITPQIIDRLCNKKEIGNDTKKHIFSVIDQIEKSLAMFYEPMQDNEYFSYVRFSYQYHGLETYTFGKLSYITDIVLQYLYHLNLLSGTIYMVGYNFSTDDSSLELSRKRKDFAKKIAKKFDGKKLRIYTATEKYNLDIFKSIIKTAAPIVSSCHCLDHGFHLMKALDEKNLRINLTDLTYQQILDQYINNPVVETHLNKLNFCTDTMPCHIAELTLLEAMKYAQSDHSRRFFLSNKEESKSELKERLSSVIMEICSYSEDVLIIASKLIINELSTYFLEFDIKDVLDSVMIKYSPLWNSYKKSIIM